MSPFLLLLLYIYTSYVSSVDITAFNETDAAEYYYASKGSLGFNTITCAAGKDCYIFCDVSSGCQLTKIQAENANNLYVECTKTSSCATINIANGPSSSTSTANILCSGDKACGGVNTKFTLTDTGTVNILCTNSPSADLSSCQDLSIYVSNIAHNANITCGQWDCLRMNIYTKSSAYDTILTCNGEESCTDTVITCINNDGASTLSYNNSWECSDNSCCPLLSNLPIIDQSTVNCFDTNCIGTYIDGSSLSSSMMVTCSADNCKYAKIICPPNVQCNIFCLGQASCQDAVVDASASSALSLTCGETESCQRTDIYCPDVSSSCSIECRDSNYTCNAMQIFQLTASIKNYLDIECPTDPTTVIESCTDISFECPSDGIINGGIYLNYPNACNIDSICCPYVTGPTSPPTSTPTLPEMTAPTTPQPSVASPSININPNPNPTPSSQSPTSDGSEASVLDSLLNDDELILFVIAGAGFLVLCICFWGSFCWWKRRKSADDGVDAGNKVSRTAGLRVTVKSPNKKRKGRNRDIDSPLTTDITLEKSIEMAPPIEETITVTPEIHSQNTITTFNPAMQKRVTPVPDAYESKPQPPSLGLADLPNSGWEE